MQTWIRSAGLALALGGSILAGYFAEAWAAQADEVVQVIKVDSRRYVFIPDHITLHKGQTVDLELSSQDVLMGFNVPDLGQRANIPPGQVVHLRLKPEKLGTYPFLCDVFCGSGHEDMSGTITVVE
jgi:cytochrome c oxidase subunit 2